MIDLSNLYKDAVKGAGAFGALAICFGGADGRGFFIRSGQSLAVYDPESDPVFVCYWADHFPLFYRFYLEFERQLKQGHYRTLLYWAGLFNVSTGAVLLTAYELGLEMLMLQSSSLDNELPYIVPEGDIDDNISFS